MKSYRVVAFSDATAEGQCPHCQPLLVDAATAYDEESINAAGFNLRISKIKLWCASDHPNTWGKRSIRDPVRPDYPKIKCDCTQRMNELSAGIRKTLTEKTRNRYLAEREKIRVAHKTMKCGRLDF